MPGRSGGQNAKSIDAHKIAGTFRRDRHLKPVPPPAPPVSLADRRRTIAGLSAPARRVALQLLEEFSQWDAASLATLRAYARSYARLEALEASARTEPKEIHREARCNLALLKALNLEVPR